MMQVISICYAAYVAAILLIGGTASNWRYVIASAIVSLLMMWVVFLAIPTARVVRVRGVLLNVSTPREKRIQAICGLLLCILLVVSAAAPLLAAYFFSGGA